MIDITGTGILNEMDARAPHPKVSRKLNSQRFNKTLAKLLVWTKRSIVVHGLHDVRKPFTEIEG